MKETYILLVMFRRCLRYMIIKLCSPKIMQNLFFRTECFLGDQRFVTLQNK